MTKHPPQVRPPKGYHRRSLGASAPPSDVRKADIFTIMRAWLDAENAHPGNRKAVLAAIDSAVQRCQGALRLSDVWADIPQWLRPYIGRPEGHGLDAIVGRWDDLEFRPGLAGLTETEARVYWWKLRGWKDWEMQRELSPGHRYLDRSRWVDIKTVYNHLWAAGRKMKGLFNSDGPASGIS